VHIFPAKAPRRKKNLCKSVPSVAKKMTNKNKIPLFSSWRNWYLFVIGVLVLLIIFFAWFTKYFA